MMFSGNGKNMMTGSPTEALQTSRLPLSFYTRDVLQVAPGLIGKIIVLRNDDGTKRKLIITETEAYRGSEDLACHASKGRTPRTEVMFHRGGKVYVYFVYGMYWMLNFVAGGEDEPQAALIRGVEGFSGPGRLTKALGIDRSFYGLDLSASERMWVEDSGIQPLVKTGKRIGINYAGEEWVNKPWRYYI